MSRTSLLPLLLLPCLFANAADAPLRESISRDYRATLAPLFDHLHRHPELSFMEVQTAARLAKELRAAGFEVTEGVGKTGVVAMLKNGPGPLVMMRADMDGLPVEEKSGLPNASKVIQKDMSGRAVPVAHACGHDVHMTTLVGTAHQMASRKGQWSGTLMLLGQPAEERVGGARDMMADQLWRRFGKPDYAIAMHVFAGIEAGKIHLDAAPYSGVDTLDITIPGIGTHGASPHTGKDPVVLGAQIVLALQTIVSRELGPREPGLITVGSFHAGTKPNIISDQAKLELTVRSENPATRELLLAAIKRVAENTGRAYGMPEHLLPSVKMSDDPSLPVINDDALGARMRALWTEKLGVAIFATDFKRTSMVAEDFGNFTRAPYIPSVYYTIGGSTRAELDAAAAGGVAVAGNHSPMFKVVPEMAIQTGVETGVLALLDLMKK